MNIVQKQLATQLTRAHQKSLATFETVHGYQWDMVLYDEPAWSVSDVLRHLVASEQGLQEHIRQICEEGEAVEPFDLDETNSIDLLLLADWSPNELLTQFKRNHAETLDLLVTISSDNWANENCAALAELGELTLQGWFEMIAVHMLMHRRDVQAAVSTLVPEYA